MSIWIANRNQNNQYIFTEGLELQQQELEEVRVGAENTIAILFMIQRILLCLYS